MEHDLSPADETSDETSDDALTGVREVDAVIRSLDALDSAPLSEHVAVFERAHEQLREALDGPSDEAGA